MLPQGKATDAESKAWTSIFQRVFLKSIVFETGNKKKKTRAEWKMLERVNVVRLTKIF